MTAIELAASLGTSALFDATRKRITEFYKNPRWRKGLAKAVAESVGFAIDRRKLAKTLQDQSLVELLEKLEPELDFEISRLLERRHIIALIALNETENLQARQLYLGLAAQLRHEFLRSLDPAYGLALTYEKISHLIRNQPRHDEATEMAVSLPPPCMDAVQSLRKNDASLADRVQTLLSEPSSHDGSALKRLLADSDCWLHEVSYQVWEILGDFISAHNLDDAFKFYEVAISKGSPRKNLYYLEAVLEAAEANELARALTLLDKTSVDDPLADVVRAILNDDNASALKILDESGLERSHDLAISRMACRLRAGTLMSCDDEREVFKTIQTINENFPAYSFGHLMYARYLMHRAQESMSDDTQLRRHLELASKHALTARDAIRRWGGPSENAVEVAVSCHHMLGDAERVCALASLEAEGGQATAREASSPGVRRELAMALASLGRFQAFSTLSLDGISPFYQHLFRALEAASDDDPDATELLHVALNHAEDDVEKSMTISGLATRGEPVDAELQDLGLLPEHKSLLKGISALRRNDCELALQCLEPWRLSSIEHVHWYGQALMADGRVDDAVMHYENAANTINAPDVYCEAVRCHLDVKNLASAEQLALRALALPLTEGAELRLRGSLIECVANLHDWRTMENYAKAAVNKFGLQPAIVWALIIALYNQGKHDEAWQLLDSTEVEPADEIQLRHEIALRSKYDATPQAIERLLQIALQNTDNEIVYGAALMALSSSQLDVEPSQNQGIEHQRLMQRFIELYPDSDVFRVLSASTPEELVELMRAQMEPGALERAALVDAVALGHLPQGMLRQIRELPYAEILATNAAGTLTAVDIDAYQREQERAAVREALGGAVVIDTSSALVWFRHLRPDPDIANRFREILFPDELDADLRWADQFLRERIAGTVGYDPHAQRMFIHEIDHADTERKQDEIHALIKFASKFNIQPSATVQAFEGTVDSDGLKPWDASLRLAADRELPLWADDLGLRRVARSLGVATFGTYALFEVLTSLDDVLALPKKNDFDLDLLQNAIADVPLESSMLQSIIESHAHPLVCALLQRPVHWMPPNTMAMHRLYQIKISGLHFHGEENKIADLVYAATLGICRAVESDVGAQMAPFVLTTALISGLRHESIPTIVEASRQACRRVGTSSAFDPLAPAVRILTELVTQTFPELGQVVSRTYITGIFASLSESDRHLVWNVVYSPGNHSWLELPT